MATGMPLASSTYDVDSHCPTVVVLDPERVVDSVLRHRRLLSPGLHTRLDLPQLKTPFPPPCSRHPPGHQRPPASLLSSGPLPVPPPFPSPQITPPILLPHLLLLTPRPFRLHHLRLPLALLNHLSLQTLHATLLQHLFQRHLGTRCHRDNRPRLLDHHH